MRRRWTRVSRNEGLEPNHREGFDQAEWVLLDYVDFVVHIFSSKSRGFYDLERLWKSARQVDENELKARAPAKRAKKKIAAKTAAKRAVKAAAGKSRGTKCTAREKQPATAKKATPRRRAR